ncbi:porin [Photobacterium nomapromontoriensis]|uniref:porin n=1 Tax=Photobacterium nomapromontoriensis TaxID=2910237 RepID=UPI003D0C54C3
MNKKLIALAVAAASLSSVANAAEVYSDNTSSVDVTGRIETAAVLSDHDVSNDGYNKARIGFAGQTEIADGINALGYVEKDFADSNDEQYRYLFVGVANENNQLGYGKADGSLGMITDFTDIMSFGGGAVGNKIAVGDRSDNNLAYVGTFNNLTVKANYVFDGGKSADADNHKGYAASAKYAMDNGLAFGLGYGAQNNGTTNENNKQTYAGVSYTMGDLYFGALYQDANRHDNVASSAESHQRGYEYAAAYTMGKTVFTATYNYLEVIHSANAPVLVNQAGVDATYYFNPNFRAYVGYTYFIEDNGYSLSETDNTSSFVPNNNQFAIGARYDF